MTRILVIFGEMVVSMSIAEAKSQFSALIDRAEAGEEVTITRHGKPVAKVVPVRTEHDRERARRAFEGMRKLREEATLGGLTIKELRDEGRK
jgi:prevent-host-death family protein